jgi:hypothetical protein
MRLNVSALLNVKFIVRFRWKLFAWKRNG